MTNILFVCLGNICRSPAAEGIMKKFIDEKGLSHHYFIDSAGILDYHEGELPDSRMRRSGGSRGYTFNSKSRPVREEDFLKFDYIIGMDANNIKALKQLAPTDEAKEKIYQMSDFLQKYNYNQIPDPYYGSGEDFEMVIDLLEDAIENFYNRELK